MCPTGVESDVDENGEDKAVDEPITCEREVV